jgi:hypothetical protein
MAVLVVAYGLFSRAISGDSPVEVRPLADIQHCGDTALCGPMIGGFGYDLTGRYTATLLLAAAVAFVAVVAGQQTGKTRVQ